MRAFNKLRLGIALLFLYGLSACSFLPNRSDLSPGTPVANNPQLNQNVALPNDKEIHEEDPELPAEMNHYVVKQMDYFLGRGRGLMTRYLERSTRYIDIVKKILKDEGVPEDLAYLALIESGFNNTARSRAKAVGYWQFMRGTGEHYGLKVDNLVDERRDPIKSTTAAARYLKGLYNLFGSWHLALAAYNVGENRVKSQVMRYQTRDLWELIRRGRLPAETKQYVPKFIAARIIAKHPEKYGFTQVDFDEPVEFEDIKIDTPVSLSQFARNLNVSAKEMRQLNPKFRTDFVPLGRDGSAELRIPLNKSDLVEVAVTKSKVSPQRIVATIDREYIIYHVRRGDSLAGIASRFGTNMSDLRDVNNLKARSLLVAGMKLRIPASKVRRTEKSKYTQVIQFGEPKTIHVVRPGETLINISKKYGVSLALLRRENNLQSRARLFAGAKLVIPN